MLSDKVKIHVENLRKNFGNLEVLKDISLDVHEGEVVCIIGPSGSGKSTFLRCLNHLEEPTSALLRTLCLWAVGSRLTTMTK